MILYVDGNYFNPAAILYCGGPFVCSQDETGWEKVSIIIPDGSHTLEWVYDKGLQGAAGADAGWVDEIVFKTAVNVAPVLAFIGNQSVNEGDTLTVNLLATDDDGDALTYSLGVGAPAFCSVAGTQLSCSPGFGDANAGYPLTINVADAEDNDSESISLKVNNVNRAPVLRLIGNQSVNEGATINVPLSATDDDGDALTYSLDAAAPGFCSIAGTQLSCSPGFNDANAGYPLPINVADAEDSDSEVISLEVINVNREPDAVNDNATTNEDAAVATSVLVNDSDPDGDAISVASSTNGAGGTASCSTTACTYTPALNFNGSDSYTYTICDSGTPQLCDTATVSLMVNPVNDAPVANDDSYSTDEDVELTMAAPGVLASDTDVEGDTLFVSGKMQPANGTVTLNPDGSFTYTPNKDYFGSDSFQYTAADGKGGFNMATVTIVVNPVNDPPVLSIDVSTQTVQYSDAIAAVTISATDVDTPALTYGSTWLAQGSDAVIIGLPGDLATSGGCTASGGGSSCTWTINGQTLVGAGTYAITFEVDDGMSSQTTGTELVVVQEDASIALDGANPVAVQVATAGGDSGMFAITVEVTETLPDLPANRAMAGDISLAEVSMGLVPVGPGGTVSATGCVPVGTSGSCYEAVLTVTCDFNAVSVNTYTANVTVGGNYYSGAAEDVLTVYDPSLGFTTGGGWFYWPGTIDRTNFGYAMKYGKKGRRPKGSLLLIRHLADDGGKYRVTSNALTGLALGMSGTDSDRFGWASFVGKNTYLAPGMDVAEGNHEFLVYVEDHGNNSGAADRLWIEVRDKQSQRIDDLSMPKDAPDHAVDLEGGNVVVPH